MRADALLRAHTPPSPAILVVEDEPDQRLMLARLLELGGFSPLAARTGEDAWTFLDAGRVPVGVLLDLRMPGMGGLAFLLRLRADPRFVTLPVTVITGDIAIDSPTEAALLVMGATLMFKPFHNEDILNVAYRMMMTYESNPPALPPG